VLLPGLDGELGKCDVEEFYGAVAACGEDLVLVRFGPCAVEEGVLGVEPGGWGIRAFDSEKWCRVEGLYAPLLCDNPVRGQAEYV
jgi:hypothetical protein